jgi:L,D-transpeptidase ErfK/SrfK
MTKNENRTTMDNKCWTRDEGRDETITSCPSSSIIHYLSLFMVTRYFRFSVVFLMVMVITTMYSPAGAETVSTPGSIEKLRNDVQSLQEQATQLDEENKGLRNMLRDTDDNELYLVVDTESNRLEMRQGNTIVLTAKVGTGSRQVVKEDRGRSWYFESPMGSLTVLGRERNPVWIRPDWSYVEENMPIPPKNDPDRYVPDVLGKYAILLGNGYKIHGTKWKNLLGTHFTHGCVSLDDDNLEIVYKSVKNGTKVYIY